MTANVLRIPRRRLIGPALPPLMVLALLLALESPLSGADQLLLAALALLLIATGVGFRGSPKAYLRSAAPLPVLLGLGVVVVELPLSSLAELLAGVLGVLFVAWLMEEPTRPPAGVARGAMGWLIPGLGVAVAWASSFLLPSNAAPVGVAGGLLAAALVLLAYLTRRPDLFDRGEPATI
jgi:hypothetical protein